MRTECTIALLVVVLLALPTMPVHGQAREEAAKPPAPIGRTSMGSRTSRVSGAPPWPGPCP